jgi:hypothetical protein
VEVVVDVVEVVRERVDSRGRRKKKKNNGGG